jgi:Ca2+-binding EF-hand superfamily protein
MSQYDELFQTIDCDRNGELSFAEFSSFCETLPQAPNSSIIRRLFNQADIDGSGFIDSTEFAALCEGLKLLTKLGEAEMIDSYATAELKRLFQYSAGNGVSLRKDEIRKAADVLNEGLSLRLSNDFVSQSIRDCGGDALDFSGFRTLLTKLSSGSTLIAIVTAFKEEEARRKERLSKVKSIFELQRHGSDTQISGPRVVKDAQPCGNCVTLERSLEEMSIRESHWKNNIEEVQLELEKAKETLALAEVESQRKIRQMENQLREAQNSTRDAVTQRDEYREQCDVAIARVAALEVQCQTLQNSLNVANATTEELDHYRSESEQMSGELKQSSERLIRCQTDLAEMKANAERVNAILRDRSEEVKRVTALMEDVAHNSQTKSEHADRIVDEIKRQCAEREDAARELAAHSAAFKERLEHMEKALMTREDTVSERERRLRHFEAKQKSKWEEKFVSASAELEKRERALRTAESEAATRNAELQVRESLLDQQVKRAESISLPERERRLRVLQGIEAELCERERRLRHSETDYIARLAEPRVTALQEQNQRLREQVDELRSNREGASLYMRPSQSSAGLDKNFLSPSFKLL